MKVLSGKTYSSSLLVILLLVAVTLSPLAAFAAPPKPAADKYNPTLSENEIRSQFGLSEEVEVVTDSQMSELIQLCHTIGAHLVRQEDGTLDLQLDSARQVGVSTSFIEDYRIGLREINELIKQGWIEIDDDFNMVPGSALPTDSNAIDAGLTEIENKIAGEEAGTVLPAGTTPDYRYSRGFLFSFHSRRYRVPYSYASLGPTFASHFRRGRYGARFSLLFGLNRGFFSRTYRYGGYGYVPYYSRYRYGYSRYYYYPYRYGRYYGRWYYRYLYY